MTVFVLKQFENSATMATVYSKIVQPTIVDLALVKENTRF